MAEPATPVDPTQVLVGFAHTLRATGVGADPVRLQAMIEALSVLDPSKRADVYWAGRLTLCAAEDDLVRYERVFAAYFSGELVPRLRQAAAPVVRLVPVAEVPAEGTEEGDERESQPRRAAASRAEVLRQRDIADLDPPEREELRRLLAAFSLPGELRRSRRWRPASRGPVDPGRTTRAMLRDGGEAVRLQRRRHWQRPRRVVLLVDVSGSMSSYADALLRFAHAAARRQAGRAATEVFTIGTRLTRVTRELSHRDPETAMRAVSETVPDFSGGTRLGELLRAFLDRWGQRGMARGAIVVVLSDGWERGDAALLGKQMERLRRLAHRVVWANPRLARPGFAPLAAGMAAALPHVDDFVEGHSLAALEHLAHVVAGSAHA